MRWSIRQSGDTWDVLRDDVVITGGLSTYTAAVQALAKAALADDPTVALATAPDGALPERWVSGDDGIVGQYATGEVPEDRDFTGCTFSWRQPPLPLMLQTETEFGHFGATLCGWLDSLDFAAPRVNAAGWFHATDEGTKARDILRAQGRFGVSVDPGVVDASFECTEFEDDGWCVAGRVTFHAYEIAGLTMTPFPAFAQCWITLEPAAADTGDDGDEPTVEPAEPEPVAASATIVLPERPPRSWFEMAEPADGDPLLVRQPDGQMGVPLTITDDGRVFGHAGLWGTCHIGRAGCILPPASEAAYAHFHVGSIVCDDGRPLAVGSIVAGCDHAALTLGARGAADWYAHSGTAWATLRASNGRYGVWLSGCLRPGLTSEQVRVLRALAPSGDWREIGGNLEMVAVLSVNVPGFPIAREALAASGFGEPPDAMPAYRTVADVPLALVASGLVRPATPTVEALVAAGTICAGCGQTARRHGSMRAQGNDDFARMLRALTGEMAEARAVLARLDQRTRPLTQQARDTLVDRLTAALS